ncbi:hypothetical protein GCM10022233_61320 [Streptomyces shaanxiensis]|uniref:Uncharacterized protein n=1 Tax=Streptomyces shaanxiensis TaxID=653357 RepID=A0ABP7VUY1_9ACTN
MGPKRKAAPGDAFVPGAASVCSASVLPQQACGQLTLTADHAAATALYSVLPVPPYRADAALRVAVRAAL